MNTDIYEQLDQLHYSRTLTNVGFDMQVTERPLFAPDELLSRYVERHQIITHFFDQALDVLDDALCGKTSPTVLKLLLGDAPPHISVDFHKMIMAKYRKIPLYFRTDDPGHGPSCEFQCPGSLWGEYALLEDVYSGRGCYGQSSIATRFVDSLLDLLDDEDLTVHHLFDNASLPSGVLYFIQRTRPRLRYFGFDKGVKAIDCRLVRSHSVYGLVAENYFKERLERAARGEIHFDLPPNLLFDAKGLLALPFWNETAGYFSDDARQELCRTIPVLSDGIENEDGREISIDQFSALPKNKRRFYLKYAGSDVSINWGSRAVFRLCNDSEKACRARLRFALEDFARGRPWILQEEANVKEDVTYMLRDSSTKTEMKHLNMKGFYGPHGLLGLMILYRKHFKVHGQPDTVATIADHLNA